MPQEFDFFDDPITNLNLRPKPMSTELKIEEVIEHESASSALFKCFQYSLRDLIKNYAGEEPEITLDVDDTIEASMTSIVGLSSPDVSASVALITSESAVASLSPYQDLEAADWLGELGNQLGGRLKNKMSCFGISPCLSTPTTVRGRFLHVTSIAAESFEVTARFMGQAAIAQLTLNIDPEVELRESFEGCTLQEGTLELF